MKNAKIFFLDYLFLIIAVAGYVLAFSFTFPKSCAGKVLLAAVSAIAVLYCIVCLYVWIFCPIRRDLYLARGRFIWKAAAFVLYIPFVIAGCFYMMNLAGLAACSPTDLISESDKSDPGLFWSIYYHFVDPGNQHMAATPVAKMWSAVTAVIGIFLLNGLLVSTLVSWFEKRREQWQEGTIRYGIGAIGKYRYAVVIGANEIASSVIKNLLAGNAYKGDDRYVILHTSQDVSEVRLRLASSLSPEMLDRVIIYHGLRDSYSEMTSLHPDYSSEIYVLGESTVSGPGEPYHDALNMKCVNILASCLEKSREKRMKYKIRKGHSVKIVCKVMFEYQTTYSIFQISDISDEVKRNLVFIPFNRFESWARRVIVDGFSYSSDGRRIDYMPLDGPGIDADSDRYVHLVIVGMSKMGISMGVQALHQAHYLNFMKRKSRITFIDTVADKEMAFFKGRYANLFELARSRYIDASSGVPEDVPWTDPIADGKWRHLSADGSNFIDVEIEFIKGEVESEGVRELLRRMASDADACMTIAVCLTQTHEAVAASLYMPIEVYKSRNLQEVWVYQREAPDIILNLNYTAVKNLCYRKLRPFGMLFSEYMPDEKLYYRAMLTNKAYDFANKNNRNTWPESLSKKTDPEYMDIRMSWDNLSVAKQWSNRFFADSIWQKIRNVLHSKEGFATELEILSRLAEDPEGTCAAISDAIRSESPLDESEHNRWNVQQLLLGFYPCDSSLFSEFKCLNARMKEIQDKDDPVYKSIKARFDRRKKEVKESEYRIHPNICDYRCLDDVDSGVKGYDKMLNESIPVILKLVDCVGGNNKKIVK